MGDTPKVAYSSIIGKTDLIKVWFQKIREIQKFYRAIFIESFGYIGTPDTEINHSFAILLLGQLDI